MKMLLPRLGKLTLLLTSFYLKNSLILCPQNLNLTFVTGGCVNCVKVDNNTDKQTYFLVHCSGYGKITKTANKSVRLHSDFELRATSTLVRSTSPLANNFH